MTNHHIGKWLREAATITDTIPTAPTIPRGMGTSLRNLHRLYMAWFDREWCAGRLPVDDTGLAKERDFGEFIRTRPGVVRQRVQGTTSYVWNIRPVDPDGAPCPHCHGTGRLT